MIAVAVVFLLLAARPQEETEAKPFTIPKQERSTYVPALQKFRDAEAVLSDPLECVKRCTELLDDKSIREPHRDALLRIQNTDGSYGDWALFAPFQLRGRASLARAEALATRDRREAAEQARLALADLDESFRRGVKSSEKFLERARQLSLKLKDAEPVPNERFAEAERRLGEIRKLIDQKSSPESVLERCEAAAAILAGTPYEREWRYIRAEAFLSRWTVPADGGRYRSARAAVAKLGGFLTDGERKEVLAKIEEKSRESARRFHAALRDLLPDQETWAALVRVPAVDIERRLPLPPPEELDEADGGLIWARRCRDRLVLTRTKADPQAAPLEEFLQALTLTAQMGVEAAGQVRDGENRAFAALEALVQDLAVVRLERTLAGASAEEAEGLGRRRDEARRIVEVIEASAALLGKDPKGQLPVVAKHLAQIRSMSDRLPIDPARLDEIGRKLLDPSDPKSLWGRTLDLGLEYEAELSALDRTQGSRLSRSARRKLGTYLLAAGITRLLLSGGKSEDLQRNEELKALARKLDLDGGPLPEVMKLVSPRVRAVVDRLKS